MYTYTYTCTCTHTSTHTYTFTCTYVQCTVHVQCTITFSVLPRIFRLLVGFYMLFIQYIHVLNKPICIYVEVVNLFKSWLIYLRGG